MHSSSFYSEITIAFDILSVTMYLPQTRERLLDDNFHPESFQVC